MIVAKLAIALWPAEPYVFSDEQSALITAFSEATNQKEKFNKKAAQGSIEESRLMGASSSFALSPFDPNKAAASFLDSAGLNAKSLRMLMKYRDAGGVIKSEEHLLKIYFMDSSWVDSVSEFFLFPDFENYTKEKDWEKSRSWSTFNESKTIIPSKKLVRQDLNIMDSVSIVSIPGLGPFYTKEILKLRAQFGGIRDYSQLTSIFKMRDETIDILTENTFIDSTSFEYININKADVEILGRHPYLTWKQAKVIVNYRFQHGSFENIEEIKNTGFISDSVYWNIEPYIRVK